MKLFQKKLELAERCITLNDIHFPVQDNKAVELALLLVKEEYKKCKTLGIKLTIALAGDILDITALSTFPKHPEEAMGLFKEIQDGKEFIEKLRNIAPKATIVFLEGNHEERVTRYCMKRAPELIDIIKVPELLKLDSFNIEYIPMIGKESVYYYNGIEIGHFNKVNAKSGYTATAILEAEAMYVTKGISQGHVHRVARIHKAGYTATETGCLCSLNPGYARRLNWQQGFGDIQVLSNGSIFSDAIVIEEGTTIFNGKIYQV